MNHSTQTADASLQSLLTQGAQALHVRDAAAARAAFERAAQLGPPTLPVLCGLGKSRYLLGQHEAALSDFAAATKLEPASADAHSLLALALARAGQTEASKREIGIVAGLLGGASFLIGTFFSRILELRDPEAVLCLTKAWQEVFPFAVTPLAVRAPALQELRRNDDYERLMAFRHFLSVIRNFHQTVPYDAEEPLNQALCRAVEATRRVDIVKDRKATKVGEQTVHLHPKSSPVLRAFFAGLMQAVAAHVQRVHDSAPGHEWVRMMPKSFNVRAWGVMLQAGGHQGTHIHPSAWLSGVYYPRVPPGAIGEQPPAGWLEIGRASAYINRPASLQVQMIRPEEGTLVLFPSYYWHSTGPAAAPGRMSLAFDVGPAGPAPARGQPRGGASQ